MNQNFAELQNITQQEQSSGKMLFFSSNRNADRISLCWERDQIFWTDIIFLLFYDLNKRKCVHQIIIYFKWLSYIRSHHHCFPHNDHHHFFHHNVDDDDDDDDHHHHIGNRCLLPHRLLSNVAPNNVRTLIVIFIVITSSTCWICSLLWRFLHFLFWINFIFGWYRQY